MCNIYSCLAPSVLISFQKIIRVRGSPKMNASICSPRKKIRVVLNSQNIFTLSKLDFHQTFIIRALFFHTGIGGLWGDRQDYSVEYEFLTFRALPATLDSG